MVTATAKFIQAADTHTNMITHTPLQIKSKSCYLIFSFEYCYSPIILDFSLQLSALGLLGTRFRLA